MTVTRWVLFLSLLVPAGALAQKPPLTNVPAAPVPAPMILGKRAFISYQFTETADATVSGDPQRDYNEFYALMKAWGRYQLVNDPKDADVVYSIRYNVGFSTVNCTVTNPSGISLWGFRMDIGSGVRQRTRDANFSDAIVKLVANIKLLVEQNTPSSSP